MPSKTAKQAKLMRAVAHGWKPSRMKGPPVSVAKEFVAADKKAKGMQVGGLFSAKKLREAMRKQDPDYDPYARYGTEPLTLKQASRRVSSKTKRGAEVLTAKREMTKAGWTESGGKWYPPQATALAPSEDVPPRVTQPIPGEGGLIEETPPPKDLASQLPPLRAAIPERLRATVAGAGRTPPSLLRYLERARAAAGVVEEPVGMQFGGAMNFMFRGRGPQQAMQQMQQRGQPPGGGGLARAAVMPGGPSRFMTEGRVPQPGGGLRAAVQPGGGRMGSDMGMQKFLRRGQVPGGGGGDSFREAMMNRGVMGPQPRSPGAPPPQPRPPGAPPMKGIGRAPGAGVPLRGVGRPPGMGRPGAGGGARDYQRMLQQRQQQATAPGAGGGVQAAVMPGGGGAGMPGAAPRIGMGDQRGALARATQVQTGRPPMSRRQPFPGRGGPGGGFGRRQGRRRGRMRR